MPKFGVARRYANDITSFLEKLHNNSIEAYEIGFAYGVPNDFPNDIIKKAKNLNIILSGHIPFFLSWKDEDSIEKSIDHIKRGFNFAKKVETIAVCHLGFYGKYSFEELKPTIVQAINNLVLSDKEYYEQSTPLLGIETTGKKSEIGTIDEVITIVQNLTTNIAIPIIDWAHLYARSNGKFPRNIEDFEKILARLETQLGIKKFYFHGSGIEYKNGQEKRHLSLKTYEPPLPYLMSVLKDAGYDYTIIVESPDAIQDLIWLKEVSKNPNLWFKNIQKQTGPLDNWMVI